MLNDLRAACCAALYEMLPVRLNEREHFVSEVYLNAVVLDESTVIHFDSVDKFTLTEKGLQIWLKTAS